MEPYDYPEYYEHPALHQAAVMRVMMHAAARQAVSTADFEQHLNREICRIDRLTGHPLAGGPDQSAIGWRVARAKQELDAAQLLADVGDHRYRLTCRGREMLDRYPTGLDESVLMGIKEYRDNLHADGPVRKSLIDSGYDGGYQAFMDGQDYTDNPYRPDSADHDAWRDGWLEARDEDDEHHWR